MIPEHIKTLSQRENIRFSSRSADEFQMPAFNPLTYALDLTEYPYFDALMTLRHFVQAISHHHFAHEQHAHNVDLFMLTSSVSSPMGPGSDSEPITIEFGGHKTHLVDSSQFGFEPLLFHGSSMVYCYLPSMRGEDPDHRHLNQFYHCECEMLGSLEDVMVVVEKYLKQLCEMVWQLDAVTTVLSDDAEKTREMMKRVFETETFPRITFDDAVKLLQEEELAHEYIRETPHGRDITAKGESALLRKMGLTTPLWVTHFDRDRVPFYQKPVPGALDKVFNADLLVPAITAHGFGGELAGSGQRQDTAQEMYESLKRQNDISADSYEWYIELRNQPSYRMTSGFGLGIERFLAWALGKPSIQDVSLYPRLKGVKSFP